MDSRLRGNDIKGRGNDKSVGGNDPSEARLHGASIMGSGKKQKTSSKPKR